MNSGIETTEELCAKISNSKSWVILNATECARDGELQCPYEKDTENYKLWMAVRFGKTSLQEQVLKKIPNNIEYRKMVEDQKPKCKRPVRSIIAKRAARLFIKGLK